MPLAAGARLGPYEVTAAIGAGGMGEVYRARDSKLGRDVALKILPELFAADADRLARFQREAQVLASLNHPHIAQIYGLEDSTGVRALVMELVEGPTLADRITQGAVPLDEAVPIARQVAEALEAAHEAGVIHRDLKPANIKLRPDGVVKVLDFGLAKLVDAPAAASAAGLSQSPTITSPAMMTGVGMILGTAAYMSPEQAKGRPADKRSDVWAFGCVLFEMLTGHRAFEGEDVSDTLASVLRGEPDWTVLPNDVPPAIRTIVRQCLTKDRRERMPEISTVLFLMRAPGERSDAPPSLHVAPRPLWKRAAPVLAAALLATAITSGGFLSLRSSPPVVISRFSMTLPDGQRFIPSSRMIVGISRDGTEIVYAANQRLYRRSMSELEPRPIAGTETQGEARSPVFSPDGRSIAFWSLKDRALKRIAVSGGAAVTICPSEDPYGVSWTGDTIAFGQQLQGIMRVAASGGKPETIASIKAGEEASNPQILPGGQAVLFTLAAVRAADQWDKAQIVVQTLNSRERKVLIENGSDGRYLSTGHIVYALGGTLFAVPFDVKRLVVKPGPVSVVDGIRRGFATGTAQFSVSDAGSLIYVPGPAVASAAQTTLVLSDRQGAVEPLKLPVGTYFHPRISPDGKRVAFEMDDGKGANIWTFDLSSARATQRLTVGGSNRYPIWSADGERIAFQSDREGDLGIFWQRADGSGTAERLTKPEQGVSQIPDSWSPDGQRLAFTALRDSGQRDPAAFGAVWIYVLAEKKATILTARSRWSVFSPDGKWIAYQGLEQGTEVWVQPFPPTGAKYQVSRDRNNHPLWSPDGKELLYDSVDSLQAITVTLRPSFAFGTPAPVPPKVWLHGAATPRHLDISPDGKRFISVVVGDQTLSATQIQIVLNWQEELKHSVPSK